jgi:hypothetical protein
MTPYTQEDYYRDPDKRRVHDHYSLFLIGALIGWLTIPVGSLLAWRAGRKTTNPILASHYCYQAASSLWMLVVIALGILGYHFLRHFDPISCPTGQVFTPPRPSTLALIAYIITCYILWIARFWRGYSILAAGRAIANPRTAWLPRATELPS